MTPNDATEHEAECYSCMASLSGLFAVGRQLYECDACGQDCCSEHSDNEEHADSPRLYCLTCTDEGEPT